MITSVTTYLKDKHTFEPKELHVEIQVNNAISGSSGSFYEPPEGPEITDMEVFYGDDNPDLFMNEPGHDYGDPLPQELQDLYEEEIDDAAYDSLNDYEPDYEDYQ